MSLKSWLVRKAIEKEINAAQKGDYGPEGVEFMDWIKGHKAVVGTLFGIGAYAAHAFGFDQVAAIITAASTFLLGGGLLKSDAAHNAGSKL